MLLVPPWFRAPVGSKQWCTRLSNSGATGTVVDSLTFTTDGKTSVPVGHFAVVVAAWLAIGEDDEDSYLPVDAFAWRIRVDGQGIVLADMPAAVLFGRNMDSPSAGGGPGKLSCFMPCPPILAPIVIPEGEGATFESYDAGGMGTRPLRAGWVTGWLCPRVNDRPGAESFLN